MQRGHAALERRFPERRLFIRSEDHTRFVHLGPGTQLVAWTGGAVFVAWAIVVTALVLMDSIGGGNARVQAQRDKMIYEDRLNALAEERDRRAMEASAAQARFAAALKQVAAMQSELLASEEDTHELETGLQVVYGTLSRTMQERDSIRDEVAARTAGAETLESADATQLADTVDFMTDVLAETAAERDRVATEAESATALAGDLDLELRLMKERSDEIFGQLEDALTISVEPLDQVFRTAGLDPEELIAQVQRGGTGQDRPLTPVQMSTMGSASEDDGTLRANRILDQLDRINLYRIAVDRVPLAMPLQDAFRYTSGFGPRWGRMHEGLDMAAPIGTPVYATAEGIVTFAGWMSGYGRIIKVQHEFGIETRYPHLNAMRVEVGQRVSRGERIGDVGNSGRSTGPHLHYEVRVDGDAVNPVTYIQAGQDVL